MAATAPAGRSIWSIRSRLLKRPAPLIVLAVLVLTIGLLLWRPFGKGVGVTPQAVHPHVSISVESALTVANAIDAWGVPSGALNAPLPRFHGQQYVVGYLTYAARRTTVGDFAVFLIDRRFHPGRVVTMWGVVPNPEAPAGTGWNWQYDEFAKKYPWLSSLGTIILPDGSSTDPAMTFGMESEVHGPLTFVAPLEAGLRITGPARDLQVVFGYLGPSGHVDWAEPIPMVPD